MKFKVDENACIGCGACEAICDEIFSIGEDGYACAKDTEVTDEDIKEEATNAMESCPTSAISEDKE